MKKTGNKIKEKSIDIRERVNKKTKEKGWMKKRADGKQKSFSFFISYRDECFIPCSFN